MTRDRVDSEVTVERGLVYAVVQGRELAIDLYRPEETDSPVVVYIHGGGWVHGDRTTDATTRVAPMAARGLTVAAIDYRLAPTTVFPAQVHDVKGAIRWLRAHASDLGIDTHKIGIWGASAGAYLGSLAALTSDDPSMEGDVGDNLDQPSAVDAVVHWFGPADLASSAARSGPEDRLLSFRFEAELLNAADQADLTARARGFSLLDRVTLHAPPFLIAHGDRDRIVSPSQSHALHYALGHLGVRSRLEMLADAGHEDPEFDSPASLAITAAWLKETLQ